MVLPIGCAPPVCCQSPAPQTLRAGRSSEPVGEPSPSGMQVGVVYGSPETTPGGMALKYTALQRIDLRKKATIPLAKEKEQTGITIRAKARAPALT